MLISAAARVSQAFGSRMSDRASSSRVYQRR
jgi:hypothetical protein